MNLPAFNLPLPPLPVEIPLLAHPPLVHFAIVLPLFILLIEIINLFAKKKSLKWTSFILFLALIVIFLAAFYTGKHDGSEAWDLLTKEGQADLKEHKLIGTYLLLASIVVLFFQLFAVALRSWWMKALYLLVLIGFVGAIFYQGKEGGELVYEHGANVERVANILSDMDDLKEELDELKEEQGSDEEEEEATSDEEESAQSTPEASSNEAKATTPESTKEESATKTTQKESKTDNTDEEKTDDTTSKESAPTESISTESNQTSTSSEETVSQTENNQTGE